MTLLTLRPGSETGADMVLGLLRTGGLDVALPLNALREVVPCPDVLTDVPMAAPGLLGVMTLRSTVVPVVDLLVVQGRVHERQHDQVVVVVAHGGRLLGVLVDEIRGLATVACSDVDELECAGVDLLSSRTFYHPELGHVVSVLDPAALLALPGVPVVRERLVDTEALARVGPTAQACALTLVRCGAWSVALDVAHVHSTIPSPTLTSSVVDGPTCLGMTSVAGLDVPVLDLLALMGLGSLAGTTLECGLVVEVDAGQVVLGVSSLVGLRDVPADAVVPVPAVSGSAPDLVPSLADVPGVGACLVLDGEVLRTLPEVRALARTVTGSAGQSASSQGATGASGPPHLSYRAGVDLASELSQVVEVLACPADLVVVPGRPGVTGFTLHRGTAVPVLDLALVLGRDREELGLTSRLLLLDVDGEPVAFAVAALHAILPTVWTDPSGGKGERGRDPSDVLGACPLVQLDTQERLLPQLDLVALVRRLRGTTAPALGLAATG